MTHQRSGGLLGPVLISDFASAGRDLWGIREGLLRVIRIVFLPFRLYFELLSDW